jgi:pimeloyl-ACP methyl ester carboxylesterase
MSEQTLTLAREGGHQLAVRQRPGSGPGVMFLGGFLSDMTGTKATHLDAWAAQTGRAFTRFDYFAHGASSGEWEDATISRWREDALAVLDEATEGPQVLVGSSLGGWMALLAAMARPERVKALVLIAPAADFTEALMWESFPLHVREAIEQDGKWMAPSAYGPPYAVTRRLIEDGRQWSILNAPIPVTCPVRILQGHGDRDVPWTHAVRTLEALQSADVTLHLSKSGDHSLSSEADLARLVETIEAAPYTLKRSVTGA